MERKEFCVYRIVTPSGKHYVGYTSMTVPERWRHHKRRAYRGECPDHPFYNELRSADPKDFHIYTLHRVHSRQEAMRLEMAEIANTPQELSVNLSSGGVNDAAEGGRIFWERLNADPKKRAEYLKKLSDTKLENDWTDYESLTASALEWRRANPKEAYRMAYRAIRIANRANGYPPPSYRSVDERPLKERLMHKYRLNEIRRENTTRIWAGRTDRQRAAIAQKISVSASERMRNLSQKEKQEITRKARDSIDREKQGAAASEGIKRWWAELKADQERYEAYMAKRTAALLNTIQRKKEDAAQ